MRVVEPSMAKLKIAQKLKLNQSKKMSQILETEGHWNFGGVRMLRF
jgi:hypothetical protein